MGVRAKFNLVFLAALTVGFALAAFILDGVFISNAREQVLENARIMMTAANAVRRYTALDLVPLLPLERDGRFVSETVPAYAAQHTFRLIREDFAGYTYREPTLNPTNLVDRAHDWEADIIQMFRNQPDEKEVVVERDTPSGRLLHLARPIVIRAQSCLACHSTPAAAPTAQIKVYGSANGFGWTLNETIGAQMLSVPMALPLKLAHKAFLSVLGILLAIFVVIFVLLNLLLHYVIIAPVRRVSAMADKVSLGEEDVEVYIKPGKDEISALSVAFNRMRLSVAHAMQLLKT